MWCKNEIVKVYEVRYTVAGIFALGIRVIGVQEANFEPGKSCMTLKRGLHERLVVRLCLSVLWLCSQLCLTLRPLVWGRGVRHNCEPEGEKE